MQNTIIIVVSISPFIFLFKSLFKNIQLTIINADNKLQKLGMQISQIQSTLFYIYTDIKLETIYHHLMNSTMKAPHYILLLIVLQAFHHLPAILAVKYEALNDAKNYPGGQRFEKEIGIPYTLEIMKDINYFIWDIFQQYNESDRKPVEVVKVFIREYDGAEAIVYGEMVNVSSLYLQGYQGNLKWEFTSLLHHEITHVFQWMGEGKAPVGLVEGVADYMILKSNYYPKGFASPGMGERWDQGYDFTARFLEYCEELKSGFVAALNKKIRYTWSEDFFEELMGKPVSQLWTEYKAKYGNIK